MDLGLRLRWISLSLTRSLSVPLNLTSGFTGLGSVGWGAWVSAGGRGSRSRLGSGSWSVYMLGNSSKSGLFCRSTFRRKFGGSHRRNPAAGGVEHVMGLKLVELFEKENVGWFSCIMHFNLLMMCQLFIGCYKTSLLQSIFIKEVR